MDEIPTRKSGGGPSMDGFGPKPATRSQHVIDLRQAQAERQSAAQPPRRLADGAGSSAPARPEARPQSPFRRATPSQQSSSQPPAQPMPQKRGVFGRRPKPQPEPKGPVQPQRQPQPQPPLRQPAPQQQPVQQPVGGAPEMDVLGAPAAKRRFWPAFLRFLFLLIILGLLVAAGLYLYVTYFVG